jgi:hypothetical protein
VVASRGPPGGGGAFERRACASCRPQGGAAGGDERARPAPAFARARDVYTGIEVGGSNWRKSLLRLIRHSYLPRRRQSAPRAAGRRLRCIQTNNHTTSEPHTHVMSNENKSPLKKQREKRKRANRAEPNTPTPPGVVNSHTDAPWMDIFFCAVWGGLRTH